MAIITCWSAKGGCGTSVVTAAIAFATSIPTVLVDLDGELPAVLGLPDPVGQGLAEWFESDAPPAAILELATYVAPDVRLVPLGAERVPRDAERWPVLAAWMAAATETFVIDAGLGAPPLPLAEEYHDGERGVRDLLVTTGCYLALRRLRAIGSRPGGVVLIDRNDGSHGEREVARSVGAPVVATVPDDPAVARAVNAGLIAFGFPSSLRKAVRAVHSVVA